MRDRIKDFHPNTDTGAIADALGIDEDDVIGAINSTPEFTSPHDVIDDWLNSQDFNPLGESNRADTDGFIEIRKRDPHRRKYRVSETSIVVRKAIDGSFYDAEYERDDEIAQLILSLEK